MSRIAIVGLACRVPGADNVADFWDNLLGKKCSISQFGDSVPESHKQQYPGVIYSKGLISGPNMFDRRRFNISPREASIMDPQIRLLLTCAMEAFADAGIPHEKAGAGTSVWMTSNHNSYCNFADIAPDSPSEKLLYRTLNGFDFAAGRVSYHLNLKGESVSMATACSSSLAAVHLAARSLETGGCDLALVGGASIQFPRELGYIYREGMIYSKDGYCRPFSHDATGVVEGDGVICCLLKRLEEALADGNGIYAVIDGTFINHDGSEKIGFTAPGISGMKNCILGAQKSAGVRPGQIAFVEAHGTGTKLGDLLEVAVLKEIFGENNGNAVYLQSAKANCGHLIHASGLFALMKTALSLNAGLLPPQAVFTGPNPGLKLDKTPFCVNTDPVKLSPKAGSGEVFAGVSNFGMAGTNTHAIVSRPAEYAPKTVSRQLVAWQAENFWLTPETVYPNLLAAAPRAAAPISADVITQEIQNFLSDYNIEGELSPEINLTDLGVDSLLLLELTDRLNKAAKARVSYRDLLKAQTLGGILKLYGK